MCLKENIHRSPLISRNLPCLGKFKVASLHLRPILHFHTFHFSIFYKTFSCFQRDLEREHHCVKSFSGLRFPAFLPMRIISTYSVRICENSDQKNSKYGHFLWFRQTNVPVTWSWNNKLIVNFLRKARHCTKNEVSCGFGQIYWRNL